MLLDPSAVTIKKLSPVRQSASKAKAHPIGNPPSTFQNPWPSCKNSGLLSLFQHRFGSHPEKNFVPVPEGPNGSRSEELVKVQKPDWGIKQQDKLRVTWIGHASFLIETPAAPGAERGVRILCDPVFSERTSPAQWFGPKRYTPPPCNLDELPDVDLIAISHSHYDHLDHATVQHVYNKRKGKIHIFAPLNNKKWFMQHINCQEDEVNDADWWDAFEVSVSDVGTLKVVCCPSQHGSRRTALDGNHSLWSGWAFEARGKKVFFSGDTGYQAQGTPSPCPAFAELGEAIGPFDVALLPISLMTPHSLMGGVHATPEQSLQIHTDVKARLSIGMHYGTVRGGISAQYEDVRDPPRRWRAAAEKEGLWCGGGVAGDGNSVDTTRQGVGLCNIGETVAV